MKLTAAQLNSLRLTLKFRASGYSILAAIRSAWWKFAALAVLAGGASAFYWWAGWPLVSVLFLGLLVGAFARDLGWYRAQKRNWPLSERIINWEAAQKLLADNESSAT